MSQAHSHGGGRSNKKALLALIGLFGTISTVQLIAALVARSDALLVDCMEMLVDTLTYVGNLAAEIGGHKVCSELLASGASLAVLYGVAVWGLVEGLMGLAGVEEDTEGEGKGELRPSIVLAFGLWGAPGDLHHFPTEIAKAATLAALVDLA